MWVRVLFRNKYSWLTQCSWSFFAFFKNPRCMWGARARKEILILLNAISFRELYLHLKSQSHRNNSLSKERGRVADVRAKGDDHIVGIHQSTHVRENEPAWPLLRQIKDWIAPAQNMRNWEKKGFDHSKSYAQSRGIARSQRAKLSDWQKEGKRYKFEGRSCCWTWLEFQYQKMPLLPYTFDLVFVQCPDHHCPFPVRLNSERAKWAELVMLQRCLQSRSLFG